MLPSPRHGPQSHLSSRRVYFSHGFSVVYKKDIKDILIALKGSSRTIRTLFKEGRGIKAVFQDVTRKAKEKAIALGIGIGSGYMYETTWPTPAQPLPAVVPLTGHLSSRRPPIFEQLYESVKNGTETRASPSSSMAARHTARIWPRS